MIEQRGGKKNVKEARRGRWGLGEDEAKTLGKPDIDLFGWNAEAAFYL